MLSVECYLKAKGNKNTKKHFNNKNLAGSVTFYFALSICISVLRHCKDI